MKHDPKAIALRHIQEAEQRIAQLTERINALRRRGGMTTHLEGMRERYTELIQLSRMHLHDRTELDKADTMKTGKRKNRSRIRLKRLGR